MSDLLLKAKQHFANFRSPEMLVEIKVPEWNTSIWYWPHQSVGEKRAIQNAASLGVSLADVASDERRMRTDHLGRHVMEFIVRARDEHGRLLCSESDFDGFMGTHPDVIVKVVAQMRDDVLTSEDAAKN